MGTKRKAFFDSLQEQPNVSVLVVGGGINGISTFRELAMQGVDVVLVEQNDFSSGSSAASSHMVHGGLRYLENAEFRLVREALTERNRLLKNAPHYVFPLPTTIPIFRWLSGTFNAPLKFLGLSQKPAERGALIIRLGLMMYDTFANTDRSMPTHNFMSKEQALMRFPGIDQDIINAATYYDAWMPYPERIALEVLLDGVKASDKAQAMNYTRVVGGGGDSVTLRDELTGEYRTIKPAIVVNAAGPWIDFANKNIGHETRFIGGTKGSHLVIDHPELHKTLGGHEIFFENTDGRIVLIFPLADRVLAGTTDIRVDDPDTAVCTPEEIDYILGLVNRIFPRFNVSQDDVVFTFSGVRPLPKQDAATAGQISRDHSIKTVEAGNGTDYPVLSLVGGKWTTFRAFGEHTATEVLKRLNMTYDVNTAYMPIGGGKDYPANDRDRKKWIKRVASQTGQSEAWVATWFERYGTGAAKVAAFAAQSEDKPLAHLSSYSVCEVRYIAANEMVYTLMDFVLRRSLIAMLGKLTHNLLVELSEIIGDELGWGASQREAQVAATRERLTEKNLVLLEDDSSTLVTTAPTADTTESALELVVGD
jgi:glycerol-3-phosphate dehydrogenase